MRQWLEAIAKPTFNCETSSKKKDSRSNLTRAATWSAVRCDAFKDVIWWKFPGEKVCLLHIQDSGGGPATLLPGPWQNGSVLIALPITNGFWYLISGASQVPLGVTCGICKEEFSTPYFLTQHKKKEGHFSRKNNNNDSWFVNILWNWVLNPYLPAHF